MENIHTDDGLKREIGLGTATLFVIGSTMGSGIFLAPQNLAKASSPDISIIAWIITALGAIMIALSFADMANKIPRTGGCVEYTHAAFGDLAAFFVAWFYWIAQTTGGATLIIACLRYMSKIFPILSTNNLLAFLVGSGMFCCLSYINIKGIRQGMLVSNITTICKLLPLLLFVILAACYFDPASFHTVSQMSIEKNGSNSFISLSAAIAITMWSFTGIESATTAGGEIKNPRKNIKWATILGTLGLVIIYLLISTLSTGILSQDQLAQSQAPIADMLDKMTGGMWGGMFIAIAVIISTLGCANGGIIVASRSAFSAAKNNLFPPIFSKLDKKHNTPAASIIISSFLSIALISMNYFKGLNAAYEFVMLLATMAALPPYIFVAAADILIARQQGNKITILNFIKNGFVPLLALLYSIYAVYCTGAEAVMWGFLLMLSGIPFYLFVKLRTAAKNSANNTSKK